MRGCAGALHAHRLDAVAGLADACGIGDPRQDPPEAGRFLHGIAGRAGNLGDDGPVKADQGVEQGGFPRVRPADQGDPNALLQDPSPVAGRVEPVELGGPAAQGFRKVRKPEIRDVLVRIVEDRVIVGTDVRQPLVDRAQSAVQTAAHLSRGVCGQIGGLGVDQVNHGLGGGQIELAVQKGPPGKLSGLGLPCACAEQSLQPGGQDCGRAVALKLHGILPGVAVRGAADHGLRLVDHPAPGVQEPAETEPSFGKRRKLHAAERHEDLPRNGGAALAGQAQNADGRRLSARSDRGDHV